MAVDPHAAPLSAPARPELTGGRRVGVLLSHGFTGSPFSMKPWGEFLAEKGYAVEVPRLPGHGTTWQELNRTGWSDWTEEIARTYERLAADTDRIVIGGLSMGGALVLRLAADRPDKLAGVILVNPAIRTLRKDVLALPVLKHVVPAFPAIANEDFLRIAPDSLLVATIRHGRPGRRMPAWGEREGALRESDIHALARHIRALAGNVEVEADPRPARWVHGDAARGGELFTKHCARCHGAEGRGGEGIALNNRVLLANATDTYLVQTIERGRRGTSMAGFAQGSTVTATLAPEEIESIVAFMRSWEVNP